MNLCEYNGICCICICDRWEDQEDCEQSEKATHANRCMYNIDGRCDNLEAQKEVM
jgi:hypothetical protein